MLALRDCPDIEQMFLVGDEAAIQTELAKHGGGSPRVVIRHASEVVGMGDSPATAVRRKRIPRLTARWIWSRAVKRRRIRRRQYRRGVAAATLKLRTLEGVRRRGLPWPCRL